MGAGKQQCTCRFDHSNTADIERIVQHFSSMAENAICSGCASQERRTIDRTWRDREIMISRAEHERAGGGYGVNLLLFS